MNKQEIEEMMNKYRNQLKEIDAVKYPLVYNRIEDKLIELYMLTEQSNSSNSSKGLTMIW